MSSEALASVLARAALATLPVSQEERDALWKQLDAKVPLETIARELAQRTKLVPDDPTEADARKIEELAKEAWRSFTDEHRLGLEQRAKKLAAAPDAREAKDLAWWIVRSYLKGTRLGTHIEKGAGSLTSWGGRFATEAIVSRGEGWLIRRARDTRSGAAVELHAIGRLGEGGRERVLALARIKHPSLRSPLELIPGGSDTIVFPAIDLPTVAQEIADGRKHGIAGAVRLAIAIAEAAASARAQGALADLVPGSIHVTPSGGVLVGLELPFQARSRATSPDALAVSCSAPERLDAGERTESSDTYAVAALLFELALGKPVFEARDLRALLFLVIDKTPDLTAFATAPQVSAILERALRKDRDDRYATLEAFVSALRAASS